MCWILWAKLITPKDPVCPPTFEALTYPLALTLLDVMFVIVPIAAPKFEAETYPLALTLLDVIFVKVPIAAPICEADIHWLVLIGEFDIIDPEKNEKSALWFK